jgi:hypothetical protein
MGRLHVPTMNMCSLDEATQFDNEKCNTWPGPSFIEGGGGGGNGIVSQLTQ